MRIVVFSDTHGNFSAMHKIFKRNGNADLFIFLGDGEIELAQLGAGAVTVAAAEGVTVHSLDGSVKLAGQYAAVCLKKIAADTWLLGGALE